MAINITFQLEENDLKYFQNAMDRVKKAAQRIGDAEIVSKAAASLTCAKEIKLPEFVQYRLTRLSLLIEMLRDPEWKLGADERRNVVSAITYFAEPEDLIPDKIPVIGYIDDAIMIELVVRDLRPEIDAYQDFCKHREQYLQSKGAEAVDGAARASWLAVKRKQLHARMRRRRERMRRGDDLRSRRNRLRLF